MDLLECYECGGPLNGPYCPKCVGAPARVINLTPEDFEEFMRILESPPAPNDKLIELLKGYTVISQGWN